MNVILKNIDFNPSAGSEKNIKLVKKSNIKILLEKLKNIFATKTNTKKLKDDTDPLILDIDYSLLWFDVNEIVGDNSSASSSYINTGKVGSMIIAKS